MKIYINTSNWNVINFSNTRDDKEQIQRIISQDQYKQLMNTLIEFKKAQEFLNILMDKSDD